MATKAILLPERLLAGRDAPLLLALRGVLVFSASAVLIFLASRLFQADPAAPLGGMTNLLFAALGAAVAMLLYFHIAYRKALSEIRRGLLEAQEGILKPVSVPHESTQTLHWFVSEYNSVITNLGSAFAEMEECQNRVIGERNRNDAILHSLPGALVCVDDDLRINLSNKQAEKLFNLPREELLGKSLFELLQLDDAGRQILRDAFLYEWEISNKEISLRFGDAPLYFTLNLSFFKSKNLKGAGAAVIMQDITDYKRLQETTYTTEKLVAMGQLAAGVAHELNTPLGNIIGYAQLINASMPDVGQVRKYTQIVSHEAKRCSRIIEDLLNYARRDRCQQETCELNAVIRDVVETIIDCQSKRFNARVAAELAGRDLKVQGSAGQLDIMLANLLMNALQASAGTTKSPRVTIKSGMGSPGYAAVIVEDNGPGVPAELHHRIFDPFFTTKEVGKGTGLGLAIGQAIAAKLGGDLRYDSSYKNGARFILKLPLAHLDT